MFASLKLNRLYNLKLPVFKFLGERTNHSENEQIYHPDFTVVPELMKISHLFSSLWQQGSDNNWESIVGKW